MGAESWRPGQALVLFGILLLGASGVLGGCKTVSKTPVSGNLPTREAQEKLVEGLSPVPAKQLRLRDLPAPKPAEILELPRPPGDLGDTPEGRVGRAEMTRIREAIVAGGWSMEPEPGKERVIFAGAEGEFLLEFDTAQLGVLAEEAMTRGINEATVGGVPTNKAYMTHQILLAGWSNAIDSRVQKPINVTYPFNHRVLMRIGELNGGGCSGTLIGRRLVLTAAHCVVPPDLSYNIHTYRARRSGSLMPFGEALSDGYWYSWHWVANNCPPNRRHDPCSQHDWAIIRLRDDAWAGSPNGTPGWMGYWVHGKNYIAQNNVTYNDGYPLCGFPSSPTNCVMNQPYGQNFSCNATGFESPHSGVPAYYRLGCDISDGHSGSPAWTDYPGSNGPYVIGTAMRHDCETCEKAKGDTKTHPNGFRGMTPWLASFITNQRVTYP